MIIVNGVIYRVLPLYNIFQGNDWVLSIQLSDRKSSQVSRTFLSIQADLSNAVV